VCEAAKVLSRTVEPQRMRRGDDSYNSLYLISLSEQIYGETDVLVI
jgi:hypothetical protein